MDWKEIFAIIGPLLGAGLTGFIFLWREIKDVDRRLGGRMDAMNKLLTDNLIAMKGEVGELKGTAHSHNPQ